MNSGLACPDKRSEDRSTWQPDSRLERAVGRDDAGRLDLHRRRLDRPQLDDRARHRRRRDRDQHRRAHLHGRTFKDFHLQLKYRAAATSNNGGVLVRGATRSRSSTTAPPTPARAPSSAARRPTAPGQAGARMEHARRDRLRGKLTSRVNGVEVASAAPWPSTAGSDRARERRQQPDVRRRADQGAGRRHDRADDHRPQRPRRARLLLQGTPFTADFSLRRRAGPRRLRRDADRRHHARAASPSRSLPRTPPATRRASSRAYSVVAFTTAPAPRAAPSPPRSRSPSAQPATFGAFTPGVAKVYTASTTATVVSHGRRCRAHASPIPSQSAPGRLVNGTLLPAAAPAGRRGATARDRQVLEHPYLQRVRAGRLHPGDRRRSTPCAPGTYSKTLTFTLSTTTP